MTWAGFHVDQGRDLRRFSSLANGWFMYFATFLKENLWVTLKHPLKNGKAVVIGHTESPDQGHMTT